MKLGEVYGEIALIYARPMSGCPRLCQRPSVEILVKAGDFERTEREIKMVTAVEAGISALRSGLDRELKCYLPMGFEEYVLYGAQCHPLKLELLGTERQQAIITIMFDMMEAMHDAWAKEHLGDLSGATATQRGMDDQFKRMFVPFPLLGWKMIQRYYRMILLLLDGCNPLPDEAMLRNCYEQKTKTFCQQQGIHDITTLQECLMRGSKFYYVLDGTAEKLFSRQQNVMRIARAISDEMLIGGK